MYVLPNFKTKKELKEAVAQGETVRVWQPMPSGGFPTDGEVSVEGIWSAEVTLVDGKITKVN